jgi:hypothetical protein
MRSIRLRSHGIGSYARPQTDAPRTTFVLALIAAAGVALPWAHGYGWSKRGSSYEQGLVALGVAVAAAYISAARAAGRSGRRWFEALGLGCAILGLCSTIWFCLHVVGSNDAGPIAQQLFSFFRPVRIAGAIGLYVSMAGFFSQLIVLAWHRDCAVQRRMRAAMRSPWTAAALIGIAAGGVLLPWNNGWPSPDRGWSFSEGVVALATAAVAAILCGLRLSGRIRLLPYAVIGILCAAIGITAVAWFHNDVVRHIDPTGYPLLVSWLNAPRLDAGLRESVSAAGFIGTISILIWQLWQGSRSNG